MESRHTHAIFSTSNALVRHTRDIPCLDGVRGVAISLVLLAHAVHANEGLQWLNHLGQLGQTGVHVFFVLSGYLITVLLLRELKQAGTISLGGFVWRRLTRIVPAYAVYLFLIWLAIPAPPSNRWWPALTYFSNLASTGWWDTGHSWSLSVEEQFYLTWPLVLTALGPRRARWIPLGVILSAPLVRAVLYLVTHTAWRALFWDFDFIAAGTLLALFYPNGFRPRFPWLAPALAIGASMAFAESIRWGFVAQLAIGIPLEALGISLTLAWCLAEPRSGLGRVLEWAPLRRLGLISYSLYLWQQPFFDDAVRLSPYVALVCAVFAACLSYRFVELPGLLLRQQLSAAVARYRLSSPSLPG